MKIGLYSLTKCNLSSSCPSLEYSYIALNSDKTCTYYTYISLDNAGDIYEGTYKTENGYLIMNFTHKLVRIVKLFSKNNKVL